MNIIISFLSQTYNIPEGIHLAMILSTCSLNVVHCGFRTTAGMDFIC